MRARTVIAAAAVFSLSVAAGCLLVVTELEHSQLSGVDRVLTLEVRAVAELARRGALNPVPTSSAESGLVQVVDGHGNIVAESASLQGQTALARSPATSRVTYVGGPELPVGDGGPYRLAALRVVTRRGPVTIYAAESLRSMTSAVHDVEQALTLVGLCLVVLVTAVAWWLVGRALSPVERIRREVAWISGAALHRRVAAPATRDEIGRLARTMNEMLQRLESSARRQREFVSDASHELRSPLAAAQTELEVALTHDPGCAWPDAARAALSELERVRRIVDDLLVLALYDEATAAPPQVEVDLDDIVLAEADRIRRLVPIELDTQDVSGARVMADAEQMRRATRNLLDNAVRHARHRVSISLVCRDERAELSVTDDGSGVSAENRERIFARFTRADDGRGRSHGGSGLGLAIVKEIVNGHGGYIEVYDAAPGARFLMTLPVAAFVADETAEQRS